MVSIGTIGHGGTGDDHLVIKRDASLDRKDGKGLHNHEGSFLFSGVVA